jgi:septal ring factor EnvC (AmiA/AmiB activator)
MVTHWWKTLTGGPTKTESARRSAPRLESLEARWVPSATSVPPVVAPTAPALTSAQELKIDRTFADQLENRLDRAQAEVKHDGKDIEADKDRISHLGKDIAKVTADIAKDTKPAKLAEDKKLLAKLTTRLDRATKDLTQDTTDLAADKLYVTALKSELADVHAVIDLDIAGTTGGAAYAARLKALSDAVHAEIAHEKTDLADDKAHVVTLTARLTAVDADIAKDTGRQLGTDYLIAGRIETHLGRLRMDITHDSNELAVVQAYSTQLDARLHAAQP